jgi:hypothetical protein
MKSNRYEPNGERRQSGRHPFQLRLLPLVVALVWLGGEQHAKAASETSLAGTYRLVSLDGNKVPCTVQHEGVTMNVKSGGFTINSDGTCSSKMVFSVSGKEASREVKATYTREGSKLTMKWEGAGTTKGTLESDTFTMNNEGMILVYKK